ncbi:unnamed protein product [Effrenium voratum]|uniref:Pentatricopeptide repeat-containing protein n=1 Tax=Effrenium voratum TaxID=2562239 RepID=A0AA36IMA0_9DINO|nr:unnamed protein product [Effrenium voratum]
MRQQELTRALLKLRNRRSPPELARELLAQAAEGRVACNVLHYNASISACERSSHWQDALDFFDEMGRQKMQQDCYSFNSIIHALSSTQWQAALRLLDDMPLKRLEPDYITYSSCIRACDQGSAWTSALAFLRVMLEAGTCNAVACSACISACGRAGGWRKALALLATMQARAVRRDVAVFNAALSACERNGAWQAALAVFEGMDTKDAVTYSASMTALEKAEKWPEALAVLQEMKCQRLKPTVVSFGAAMSASARGSQWPLALCILEELRRSGFKLGPALCSGLLQHGFASLPRPLAADAAMLQDKVAPDDFASSVLLAECEQRRLSATEASGGGRPRLVARVK